MPADTLNLPEPLQKILISGIAQTISQMRVSYSLVLVKEGSFAVFYEYKEIEEQLKCDVDSVIYLVAITQMGLPDSELKVWKGKEVICEILKKGVVPKM